MSDTTFKLARPHMTGEQVLLWQRWLLGQFASWDIAYALEADGDYGQATRAATASMCRAWGMESAAEAMEAGVTPTLRIKLRNDDRTAAEQQRFKSEERMEYRRALRRRFEAGGVSLPVARILEDSWGWHGEGHDGIDLICAPNSPALALCRSEVVRADASGWSGAYAPLGDGIVILRSLADIGPIQAGDCYGYGHCEKPIVGAGDVVRAGEQVGSAGLANAWHLHWMRNTGGFPPHIGHGDVDPRSVLNYLKENA